MSQYEDENLKILEQTTSDNQGVAQWKCLCKHCGNIFITRGSSIRAGYVKSCGCVHSRNEQLISRLLQEANIEYATQYTFPNLTGINGGHLRFDFAIFKNGTLSHLIEYNGKQHYKQAEGSWAEGFEILQEHDERKRQYCLDHNIRLITLKYDTNYSLEDLL